MKNQTGPFLVQITLVNATANATFAFIPPGEAFGPYEDLRAVYHDMRAEWGGKVSSMFLDRKDRSTIRVGWIFTKRDRYDDCDETYVREAWVEVLRETAPYQPAQLETVDIGGATS